MGKNKQTNATPNLHFALQTSDMHSQLSQIATLTSNLGQQNRGINRVAKTPSLNPPTKMHAFKVFWFVKILTSFSANETMQK